MKKQEIPPGTISKDMIIDPETGEEKEVDVERVAGINLNPGDLDEIMDEIKKLMYEELMANPPESLHQRPIQVYYMAIRQMYRKKHQRLVNYMDMLEDNEKIDIHTATEEQILKIGTSEESTPISLAYFEKRIREDLNEIIKEFRYRMDKKNLIKHNNKEQKEFVGKNRFV